MYTLYSISVSIVLFAFFSSARYSLFYIFSGSVEIMNRELEGKYVGNKLFVNEVLYVYRDNCFFCRR